MNCQGFLLNRTPQSSRGYMDDPYKVDTLSLYNIDTPSFTSIPPRKDPRQASIQGGLVQKKSPVRVAPISGGAMCSSRSKPPRARRPSSSSSRLSVSRSTMRRPSGPSAGARRARTGRAVGARGDGPAPGRLCGNQIFNPTSMRAYATIFTRAFLSCFENSMRAIDSSKNQPNRLRFDRDREV